jgi:hypothetical protein
VLARLTRAVVIAEAVAVAGCASIDRAYYTVTDTVEAAFTSHHHTVSVRARRPPASPASPWGHASTAEAKPATPPEPEPVVVNGLSGNAVRALLGQPTARAGPALGETWTYRSGSCVVELFLFPNVTHGGLEVLDSRVSGSGEASKQACLRRLRDASSG